MNEKKIFDLVFILDKSGSMTDLKEDTIGGFNSMIEKQRSENENDEVFVSTILFDNKIELLHDRVPLNEVKKMTNKDYIPCGSTSLFDAIGFGVNHEDERVLDLARKEEKTPDNTLFIITTDGYENSSTEYTYSQIRKLIQKRKEQGVDFLFLGANIDSDKFAEDIGIGKENSRQFKANKQGVETMYNMCSESISFLRKRK